MTMFPRFGGGRRSACGAVTPAGAVVSPAAEPSSFNQPTKESA